MQRMPLLTWGDSGLEDAKSGQTGQPVNHQLQRVPRRVSFRANTLPTEYSLRFDHLFSMISSVP